MATQAYTGGILSYNNTLSGGTSYRSFLKGLYDLFKVGGALASKWAVVPGAGGQWAVGGDNTWNTEANATTGSWFRVRCTTAWSNGFYQEFLLGYTSAAAALAQTTFTASGAAGIHVIASAYGSNTWSGSQGTWIYTAPYSQGGTTPTGVPVVFNTTMATTTYHVWAENEAVLVMADNGAGAYSAGWGLYCGKLIQGDSVATTHFFGQTVTPGVISNSTGWTVTSTAGIRVLNSTENGYNQGFVEDWTAITDLVSFQTPKDARPWGLPILFVRAVTANRVVGYWGMNALRCSTAITALNQLTAVGSNTKCMVRGLMLPWSAAT